MAVLPLAINCSKSPTVQPITKSYDQYETRRKLQLGTNFLDQYVRPTFGPCGRLAFIKTKDDTIVTKEGSIILPMLDELDDRVENGGCKILTRAALETCALAGDGSKSTVIFANLLIAESIKVDSNGRMRFVVRGIDKTIKALVAELKFISQEVKDVDQLTAVARLSAKNDLEVVKVIAEALNQVGGSILDGGEDSFAQLVEVIEASRSLVPEKKKIAIEKALVAIKAAVEEGIVVGGGCTLLRLVSKVDAIKDAMCNNDEKAGADIVKSALTFQLDLIALTTEFSNVPERVMALSLVNPDYGFNAETRRYEDLMAAGIIEPTKVVRCILENASAMAQKILKTGSSYVRLKKSGNDMKIYSVALVYNLILQIPTKFGWSYLLRLPKLFSWS